MEPLLGPCPCTECHAPGLWWFGKAVGWVQKNFMGTVLGVRQYVYVAHVCTARDVPEQLRR